MGVFDKAQSLNAKPKTAKGKKDKVEVELQGLRDYALLSALIKNLETLKDTIEVEVKDQAFDKFVEFANGKRPENFRGTDGNASASVEVRKRSTRSTLSQEEQDLLTKAGVPFDTEIDVAGTFVINPTYLTDTVLMAKVEKALEGVKGLPADFIQKQEPVTRVVATDESVDKAFATEDEDAIRAVTVLALKPTVPHGSLPDAIRLAAKLVDPASHTPKLKGVLKASLEQAAKLTEEKV